MYEVFTVSSHQLWYIYDIKITTAWCTFHRFLIVDELEGYSTDYTSLVNMHFWVEYNSFENNIFLVIL